MIALDDATPLSSSAIARQLSVCTFADEKTTAPKKVGQLPWPAIIELHRRRRVRHGKSGRMFGGYAITGTRANDNVPFRSLIQLDIDTEGDKDDATGRILKVTRQAPSLDQIRPAIDEYEWCAVSSHWHEPQRDVIKYRVVIPPDRDIRREEWEPILEALDERLRGALDRKAWPWSQAFYLPSCSPENEGDAFFEHNQGAPLPVDDFVRRGREIIAAKAPGAARLAEPKHEAAGGNIAPSTSAAPPVEEMRAMLKHLAARDCFEERSGVVTDTEGCIVKVGWIETGMALKPAYGDEVGFDLWDVTHVDDRARADAPAQWASFAAEPQPGHVTIGTIIKAAKDAGFTHALSAQPVSASLAGTAEVRFTGTGVDEENGKLFADAFRNRLLYVYETGDWLQFSPRQGWVSAQPGEADRAAKEVLTKLRREAGDRYKVEGAEDPSAKRMMAHVRYTSKATNLRAMIEMAKSEPGMTVRLSDFDDDPMLLGVTNGVLDLRTSKLLPVSPDVLVSKRCNVAYDPSATCPRTVQFLKEVQPEKETAFFLLRLMGSCLTGDASRQGFGFLYGHGANGKSVLIELIAWLLGDYAHKIPTEMLMRHQRNPQGPSPDIVSLKGRRFVYANETEEGGRLDEARIKDLTGGDTLTGRAVYGKANISFRPSFKLFVVGNHKPEIADTSYGMWRRVALIPFEQTIPEAKRDPKLLEALKGEGSGILNVLLFFLRDCEQNGLSTPEKIKAATAAYRDEQDILGDWLGENCNAGPSCSVQKKVLYADYVSWTDRNGHRPFSQSKLTRRLNDRGYELAADKRTVTGLSLKWAAGMARNG